MKYGLKPLKTNKKMNIYQQELLDHYHNSCFKGPLAQADFCSGEYNPSCGDRVSIAGQINNGLVQEIAFEGAGCVISQAAASMLCQDVKGKSVDEIRRCDTDYMISLIAIPLGPTRLKCALLGLQALQQGLVLYQSKMVC